MARLASPAAPVLLLLLAAAAAVSFFQTCYVQPHRSWKNPQAKERGALVSRRQEASQVSMSMFPEMPDVDQVASALDEYLPSVDTTLMDEEQKRVIDAVLAGRNVLITGGAGVGKTFVGEAIRQALKMKYKEDFEDFVGVTAPTGTAAVLIGGCTLNKLAGITVPEFHEDFRKMRTGYYGQVWRQLKVLMIDEASMVSGEMLDQMDIQLKVLRRNDKPFGGIQVVLLGDFFQLTPIQRKLDRDDLDALDKASLQENKAMLPYLTPGGQERLSELFLNRGMIFQSNTFWDLELEQIELVTQYRQGEDKAFATALTAVQDGQNLTEAIDWLNSQCEIVGSTDAPPCDSEVQLFPFNSKVKAMNEHKLEDLPGKSEYYQAKDYVVPSKSRRYIEENTTDGTVEKKPMTEKQKKEFLQKAPFYTAEAVAEVLELKRGAQVMLSANLDVKAGLINGLMGEVIEAANLGQNGQVVVRFRGFNTNINLTAFEFQASYPGIGISYRRQIPLRLAWAMTHHRCQGQTFDYVRLDPTTFTQGQAYVALSRARSAEGLKLYRKLEARDIIVNPAAINFRKFMRQNDVESARKAVGDWRDIAVDDSKFNFKRPTAAATTPIGIAYGPSVPAKSAVKERKEKTALRPAGEKVELARPPVKARARTPLSTECVEDRTFKAGPKKGKTFKEVMADKLFCQIALKLAKFNPSVEILEFVKCLKNAGSLAYAV